jgi:hypothetical protein
LSLFMEPLADRHTPRWRCQTSVVSKGSASIGHGVESLRGNASFRDRVCSLVADARLPGFSC